MELKHFSLLLVLVLGGCGQEPLEMTRFTDNYMTDAFVKELEREGVEFQRNGQQVFYPASSKAQVSRIADKVLEENSPKTQIHLEGFHAKVVDAFKAAGIRYREIHTDTGPALTWPDEQDEAARRIVSEVLRARL